MAVIVCRDLSLNFIKNEINNRLSFKEKLNVFVESSQDLEFGGVGLFGRIQPKDSAKARTTFNHVTPGMGVAIGYILIT
jgi:hypothetical protein